MSKLIDKLKLTSQSASPPMGFGRDRLVSSKPGILLIARVVQPDLTELASQVAGADAGLLDISKLRSDIKTLSKCAEMVPDIPWGGWLSGDARLEGQLIKVPDCDFVVFPAESTPLKIVENTKAGKILEVEPSLSEGLLRTVNELPVDGVLLRDKEENSTSLSWHRLMLLQRCADLIAKPLLAPVASDVTASELKLLWEVGVDGVALAVDTDRPAGGLVSLREAVSKLISPSQRRRGKVKALLPQISRETVIENEEELPSEP